MVQDPQDSSSFAFCFSAATSSGVRYRFLGGAAMGAINVVMRSGFHQVVESGRRTAALLQCSIPRFPRRTEQGQWYTGRPHCCMSFQRNGHASGEVTTIVVRPTSTP